MKHNKYRQFKQDGLVEVRGDSASGEVTVRRRIFDTNTGNELEPKVRNISVEYLQRTKEKLQARHAGIIEELADIDEMIADVEIHEALIAEANAEGEFAKI